MLYRYYIGVRHVRACVGHVRVDFKKIFILRPEHVRVAEGCSKAGTAVWLAWRQEMCSGNVQTRSTKMTPKDSVISFDWLQLSPCNKKESKIEKTGFPTKKIQCWKLLSIKRYKNLNLTKNQANYLQKSPWHCSQPSSFDLKFWTSEAKIIINIIWKRQVEG